MMTNNKQGEIKMNDNMKHWNALANVPTQFLKAIGGGKLKGKSDINPQWRIKVMTETFGPCGIGWRYEIKKLWTEPGDNGEVCAFALVEVSVKTGEQWSNPIPGVGGSMLVAQESGGKHTSDEAYKMAVTDALSVALKALGVAADIYLGKWDGSKYRTDGEQRQPRPATPTTTAAPAAAPATDDGEHYCSVHQCKFFRNEKDGKVWYSHKIRGTNEYCREVLPAPTQLVQVSAPPKQAAPEIDPDDPHNW